MKLFLPLAAGLGSLEATMRSALNLIMAGAFIWGVIVVASGASALSRGEEGMLKIVSGVLMAGSATIMLFAFGGKDPLSGF